MKEIHDAGNGKGEFLYLRRHQLVFEVQDPNIE